MALDWKTTLYDQIWALLEANATFTTSVKSGCRIKADDPDVMRQISQSMPSDFPQLKIELKRAKEAQGTPRTFGMNSTSYSPSTCDYPVPISQDVLFTITYDALRQASDTPIEATIKSVLYAKFPKLGLSFVNGFTINEERDLTSKAPETAKTLRRIVKMTVTVTGHIKASQLQ